jgi:hypothetical protein
MPKSPTVHLNPPGSSLRARCGVRLARVEHRPDINDCSCNTCIRLDALDKADAPGESPVSESQAFRSEP